MGIVSLLPQLKSVTNQVHISQYSGLTAGVDAMVSTKQDCASKKPPLCHFSSILGAFGMLKYLTLARDFDYFIYTFILIRFTPFK